MIRGHLHRLTETVLDFVLREGAAASGIATRETLLSERAPGSATVVIPGRGSSLIGGQRKTELGCDEVVSAVLDSFFPEVRVDAKVTERKGLGLCLRPGFGYMGDEARMELMLPVLRADWRSWEQRTRTEWWILWRRVAGGLDRRTQEALFKSLALMLISRRTDDRSRDIDEELRSRVLARLEELEARSTWITMVEEVVEDEDLDQSVLGESLPPGLRLFG